MVNVDYDTERLTLIVIVTAVVGVVVVVLIIWITRLITALRIRIVVFPRGIVRSLSERRSICRYILFIVVTIALLVVLSLLSSIFILIVGIRLTPLSIMMLVVVSLLWLRHLA